MEDVTLRGWFNGQRLPNPEAFGYKWRPMQKLLKEHARIWQESRDNGRRYQEIQAEIERLKHQETEDLAASIRTGTDEPDGSSTKKAQQALERCQRRAKAIKRALDTVNAEILAVVHKHAEEWREEAQKGVEEKEARVQALASELAREQNDLKAYVALRDWLSRPEHGFAFKPGPASLENAAVGAA